MREEGQAETAANVRMPDFIIAGAMKCGTTSMHSILNSHPDVFAGRNRRLRDGVGVLECIADDAQVSAASPAKLATLSFLRTAGWAVHIGGLYGKSRHKFLTRSEESFVPFCGSSRVLRCDDYLSQR